MAIAEVEGIANSRVDLSQESFNSWTWTTMGANYQEFRKLLKENNGGLFCIRWNTKSGKFDECSATINVAYGFAGRLSTELSITSYPDDILYIGKALDVSERIGRMFSTRSSCNAVARKIAALLDGIQPSAPGKQRDRISADRLREITPRIVFDFIEESNPIKRDFMKAYAVYNDKPCLNIGLEH